MPFVAAQPAEKRHVLILGEIRADADVVFTSDIDHVLEDVNTVLHRRLITPGQEGGIGGDTDKAAVLGDHPQLRVAFVARMLHDTSRAAVGKGDGLTLALAYRAEAARVGTTDLVTMEALETAIRDRVPARFLEINLKALQSGYALETAQLEPVHISTA